MSLFKFKKEKVTKTVETTFLSKEQMGGVVGGIDTLGVTDKDTSYHADTLRSENADTTRAVGHDTISRRDSAKGDSIATLK